MRTDVLCERRKKELGTTTGYKTEQVKELQDYFKTHDFTETISLGHQVQVPDSQAAVFKRSKEIFTQYWLKNLPVLGIKRPMKDFTNDYPIKLLQNADAVFVSEDVAGIHGNQEDFDEAFETFCRMFAEPCSAGFEAYCKSSGKDLDSLTDEDCAFVIEKVAEVIDEELIKVLMIGQQVPDLCIFFVSVYTVLLFP